MDKKYGIAAAIVMLIAAGYIIYTSLWPNSNTTSESNAPADTFLEYQNNEFGFSFNYPATYGALQLKKFVSVGYADEVKFSKFSFPKFSSSTSYLGINVQGNEYNSGKDGVSVPICPRFATEYDCNKKINSKGTEYYEVHFSDMPADTVRYEFPLVVEASLVFYYYEESSSQIEKITLQKIVDSVVIDK